MTGASGNASSSSRSVVTVLVLFIVLGLSRGVALSPHENGLECTFLPDLDRSFAGKLEARSEARRHHRCARVLAPQVLLEPVVKPSPIVHPADQPFEDGACFLDRPRLDPANGVGLATHFLLAPFGIGLQKVNEI